MPTQAPNIASAIRALQEQVKSLGDEVKRRDQEAEQRKAEIQTLIEMVARLTKTTTDGFKALESVCENKQTSNRTSKQPARCAKSIYIDIYFRYIFYIHA